MTRRYLTITLTRRRFSTHSSLSLLSQLLCYFKISTPNIQATPTNRILIPLIPPCLLSLISPRQSKGKKLNKLFASFVCLSLKKSEILQRKYRRGNWGGWPELSSRSSHLLLNIYAQRAEQISGGEGEGGIVSLFLRLRLLFFQNMR